MAKWSNGFGWLVVTDMLADIRMPLMANNFYFIPTNCYYYYYLVILLFQHTFRVDLCGGMMAVMDPLENKRTITTRHAQRDRQAGGCSEITQAKHSTLVMSVFGPYFYIVRQTKTIIIVGLNNLNRPPPPLQQYIPSVEKSA